MTGASWESMKLYMCFIQFPVYFIINVLLEFYFTMNNYFIKAKKTYSRTSLQIIPFISLTELRNDIRKPCVVAMVQKVGIAHSDDTIQAEFEINVLKPYFQHTFFASHSQSLTTLTDTSWGKK